jgi:hypothetical protein
MPEVENLLLMVYWATLSFQGHSELAHVRHTRIFCKFFANQAKKHVVIDEDNVYSDDRFKKFYIKINSLTAHIA